jgi:hypothetical protein
MSYPTIVIYSHTDYEDVWPVILGQNNLFFKNYPKKLFINKHINYLDNNYKQFFYYERENYTNRILSCLKQLDDEEIIIFMHEDMPLFSAPNHEKILDFCNLIENEEADFIQLLKSSQNNIFKTTKIHSNLIQNESGHLFSVQPTICHVKKIKKLFEAIPNHNIWEFENKTTEFCKLLNLNKCFMVHEANEPKRGLYHWDSFIYPYIATAIVKGRWNLLEYNKELTTLFDIYNIDKNKRGTNIYV